MTADAPTLDTAWLGDYVVLARWKLAVVLEQGFQRAGDDLKLNAFGDIVLQLMAGAAELAESTDYAIGPS